MLSLTDQPFREFKEKFYSVFPKPEDLDCEDFNLLKVVLDGLKTNYVSKNWYNDFIFKPVIVQQVLLFLKRLKDKKTVKLKSSNKPYLIFDNGRKTESVSGQSESYYFHNVTAFIGLEKCYTLFQTGVGGDPEMTPAFADIRNKYSNKFHNEEEKQLIADLQLAFKKIKQMPDLSGIDRRNIATAFNGFFFQFKIFNRFFKDSHFTHCLFDQHYHREGMILALKRNGIKSVEFQHGLIVPEDIFYVFPKEVKPVAKKALFPDKILTYSEYWSSVLKQGYEFQSEQIDTIGQYQCINTCVSDSIKQELSDFTGNKPFILITTQTFLHNQFIDYARWLESDLEKRKEDVAIVVKLHPAEKRSDYQILNTAERIRIMDCNTEFLLSKCSHHVSVYSTTLYDGSKYKCRNYSLNVERCKDYVQALVKSGVSELLELNENPLDKKPTLRNSTCFYENFDEHKYKLLEL